MRSEGNRSHVFTERIIAKVANIINVSSFQRVLMLIYPSKWNMTEALKMALNGKKYLYYILKSRVKKNTHVFSPSNLSKKKDLNKLLIFNTVYNKL